MPELLTEQDFINASQQLGCEVAVIKAVCQVEAPRGGFDSSNRPVILYEPFLFSDYTKHAFDNATIIVNGIQYPLSCNRRVKPWSVANAKYGPVGVQYSKLEEAKKLNASAALQACSWGKFQILGSNYRVCGFSSPEEFVAAMQVSEGEHLKAFINFVKANKLDVALKNKNFEEFAVHYNGPRQDKGTKNEKDDYDYYLQKAYEKFKITV